MTKYIKTGTTEFEQLDGWQKTFEKYGIRIESADDLSEAVLDELVPRGRYFIKTLECELECHIGDWIATGVNGEHWAVTDDVFKKTYAELPVISKVYADMIEEYKTNHYPLSEIFTEWDWHYDEQEMIARAWLDGYEVAEVEE